MVIPVILFLSVFEVFLLTHCATFNINDSGETIMVCDLLTISHSPGYPLHTLWGRVFCLLPIGKPMFRVTFSSMVTGALTVVMIYWILKMAFKEIFAPEGTSPLSTNPSLNPPPAVNRDIATGEVHDVEEDRKPGPWLWEIPALFGSLVFAFSYQFWFQACGAKGGIYTLNALLSVSMLFLFFKMKEKGWFVKSFLMMCFLYGLSLAHHWPHQVVVAPAYLWFLLSGQKKFGFEELVRKTLSFPALGAFAVGCLLGVWLLDDIKGVVLGAVFVMLYLIAEIYGWANWAKGLSLCLLSLSAYMYLTLRSIQNPIVNWWNPNNLDRLIGTVARKGYQGIGDKRSFDTMARDFNRFLLHAHHQFGDKYSWIVVAVTIWGLYWLWSRKKATAVGFFLFGFGIFAAVVLNNNPLEGYQWTVDNFFTTVFMATAMISAAGVAGLLEAAARAWPYRVTPLYASAFTLGCALMPLILNWQSGTKIYSDLIPYNGSSDQRPMWVGNDQSRYVSSYDEGINMLRTVNKDGVIICNGDIDILPLWYLQFVEGKRPEVVSFTMQLIPYDWYREPLFKRWPFLYVPLRKDVTGHDDIRPDTVVQDMIDQHSKDRSFYFTNIFTAPWMRERNAALPEGFLWRMINTKDLNYPFTAARLNQLWDSYRLRNLDAPERGYWDEYTDVMKDSYGIGYDFTGYFAFMNKMPDLALWGFNNALKYRQPQTLVRIYMMLGETYMMTGDPGAAINEYQETLRRDPRNPLIYVKIGDAYFQMKDMMNAQSAYQQAAQMNPQQAEAMDGLLILNNASGAVKKFQDALKVLGDKNPQNAPQISYLYAKMGDAYLMLKDNTSAKKAYQKALDASAQEVEAATGLKNLGEKPSH